MNGGRRGPPWPPTELELKQLNVVRGLGVLGLGALILVLEGGRMRSRVGGVNGAPAAYFGYLAVFVGLVWSFFAVKGYLAAKKLRSATPAPAPATDMTAAEARQIAASYAAAHSLPPVTATAVATWQASAEKIEGPAWMVEAPLPPSTFEGSGTITYAVAVRARGVAHFYNSSGFLRTPEESGEGFTEEELEELGFDPKDYAPKE